MVAAAACLALLCGGSGAEAGSTAAGAKNDMDRALEALGAMDKMDDGGAAGTMEEVEQLLPQDDPNYQAWSQHLGNHHRQWALGTAQPAAVAAAARRRTQDRAYDSFDASTFTAARDSIDADHGAAEIRNALRFDSLTGGPITGRNTDGTFVYGEETPENGAAKYERLRASFSSASCDDPLALNHGSATAACTYR